MSVQLNRRSLKWFGWLGMAAGIASSTADAQSCSLWRRPDVIRGLVGGTPTSVVVFDDGSGPAMFVGTRGLPNGLRRRVLGGEWEPAQYAAGVAPDGGCRLLYVDDDPALGRVLLAGCGSRILRWVPEERAWTDHAPVAPMDIYTIVRHRDTSGSYLVIASPYQTSGAHVARRLVNGTWTPMGTTGTLGGQSLVSIDEDGAGPNGPRLYAVGRSASLGSDVVRWNGTSWEALPFYAGWSNAAVAFDDGSGPSLFVSGHASSPRTTVTKWSGTQWQNVGPLNGPAQISQFGLISFDDGTGRGAELYAESTDGVYRLRDGAFERLSAVGVAVAVNGYQQLTLGKGRLTASGPEVLWTLTSGGVVGYVGCPRCSADFDLSGSADVSDIFAYLERWFAGGNEARLNAGTGTPTVQDLLNFLAAWFTGC